MMVHIPLTLIVIPLLYVMLRRRWPPQHPVVAEPEMSLA